MNEKSMTEQQKALYQQVLAFSIDEMGAELSFADRLALENGWSPEFSQRAVIEYKKFIFLATQSDHAVTPSDQVDQVWHLHLTYTISYWDRLCKEVLLRPVHHHPTLGGGAEAAKFREQYQATLESYKSFFGKTAPKDLWPRASVRFRDGLGFVRVNTQRVWLVSKRRFFLKTTVVILGLVSVSVLIFRLRTDLAGKQSEVGSIQNWVVNNGLALVLVSAVLLAVAVNIRWRLVGRASKRGKWGAACDSGDSGGGGDAGGCGGGCGD